MRRIVLLIIIATMCTTMLLVASATSAFAQGRDAPCGLGAVQRTGKDVFNPPTSSVGKATSENVHRLNASGTNLGEFLLAEPGAVNQCSPNNS